jgi:hypothetical protein
MLDVHVPHPTHTWKDFFIHIATIVVGLFIAIGLEQTVEFFHHRHLAEEARSQLLAERATNQNSNDFNIFATQRHELDLKRDLAILHAIRRRTPRPPGPFLVRHLRYLYLEDEWRQIHQTGTIAYLRENLRPIDYRYETQDAFMTRADRSVEDLYRAAAVLRSENDPLTTTYENNLANSDFTKKVADSNESLSDAVIEREFAAYAEPGDPSKLTPAQLDTLEHALQVALADDDALLTYCFNIKRNLNRNPQQ